MTSACKSPMPVLGTCPAKTPTADVTIRRYVCGLTKANKCEIIELDHLYYVSTADANEDDPRLAAGRYSKGLSSYDEARQLSNQCQCDNGLLCNPCNFLRALPEVTGFIGQ